MDGHRDYHTKGSKPWYTYMWTLKESIQMNLFTKQKQRHRKQIYDYQRGEKEG